MVFWSSTYIRFLHCCASFSFYNANIYSIIILLWFWEISYWMYYNFITIYILIFIYLKYLWFNQQFHIYLSKPIYILGIESKCLSDSFSAKWAGYRPIWQSGPSECIYLKDSKPFLLTYSLPPSLSLCALICLFL